MVSVMYPPAEVVKVKVGAWAEVQLSPQAVAALNGEAGRGYRGAERNWAMRVLASVEDARARVLKYEIRAEDDPERVAFWQAFDMAYVYAVRFTELGQAWHDLVQKKLSETKVPDVRNLRPDASKKVLQDYLWKIDWTSYREVYLPVLAEFGLEADVWLRALSQYPGKGRIHEPAIWWKIRDNLREAFPGCGKFLFPKGY